MTSFVLVPGAGGSAWYWHLVVPELTGRGYDAVAVDIREDDPALGLADYADTVEAAVRASGDPSTVVLVAQSMGAFTAPVVAHRVRPRMIVLVNPMIPLPGETPGQWWDATGQPQARVRNDELAGRSTEFSVATHFLHDVPADVAASGADHERDPADTPFGQPCEMATWPSVETHVLLGRHDRLFPLDFARRVARDRLGLEPDEIEGGHLVALSNPVALAQQLVHYAETSPR